MLANLSPILALLIFAAASAAVCFAGAGVARLAEGVSQRFNIGEAFVGMLLLGGITSLPEVATVATSAHRGDAPLAVNNVFGSVAINLLLLAVADLVLGRHAMTSTVGSPTTLMQGVLSMLLLTLAAAAIVLGDQTVRGIGLWSVALLASCVVAFWLSARYAQRAPWTVKRRHDRASSTYPIDKAHDGADDSAAWLIARLAGLALAVLVGGYALSETAGVLAQASGVGRGLLGLVLVAFATSLPELSTLMTAIRRRRTEFVVGDIFGTNVFNMLLIFLADAVYRPFTPEGWLFSGRYSGSAACRR